MRAPFVLLLKTAQWRHKYCFVQPVFNPFLGIFFNSCYMDKFDCKRELYFVG